MSENNLMIPDASSVPAYVRNAQLAADALADAMAGITTGQPPRVKLSGKQYLLVDSSGNETPFPPASLTPGDDGNVYFPVIVLRAKKALSKVWYLEKYNPQAPKEDFRAPDCFSNDGEKPDSAVKEPQSQVCASCPNNAYGSGTDQDGNPTKGKACGDKKTLAVFVPGFGVHKFDIPAASLKNWGLFMKQFAANLPDVPLRNTKVWIGFDLTTTTSVLVFKFGGFLGAGMPPEKQTELLNKIAELAESAEAAEIVRGTMVAARDSQITEAQNAGTPVAQTEDDGLGLNVAEDKKKADTAAKKAAAAAAKKAAAADAKAAQAEVTSLSDVSDADLGAMLGL